MPVFLWLDDRLALQEILDDVGSKFVPPHVKLFYCFGGLVLTAFFAQVATGFALNSIIGRLFPSPPYDQVGYWALRIVSGVPDCIPLVGQVLVEPIRGGPRVGQATLLRFYSLHTLVLPVAPSDLMSQVAQPRG